MKRPVFRLPINESQSTLAEKLKPMNIFKQTKRDEPLYSCEK